jgi:hypothetical protein
MPRACDVLIVVARVTAVMLGGTALYARRRA